MKRFILILCALLAALPLLGCNGTKDIPVPQGETVQVQRSSLVLGIENSQLLVGETGILQLTVWCNDSVTDTVTVTDEKETVVAVLENDGSGLLKGTVEILEETPRFGSLTAVSGKHRSQPVSFRVTPEVTDQQVQLLADVVTDLAAAVAEQNFPSMDSPEAMTFVEEALAKDSRVSGFTNHGSAILFTTTDGLVGAYSGAERESDSFGFSNPDDVYETHKTGGDVSEQFLFGDMTVTNTKGLFLVPNPDDSVIKKYYGYYEEKVRAFLETLGGSCQYVHGVQAHDLLYTGEYNDCGMMLINTHGLYLPRANGTDMLLLVQLTNWDYLEGSLDNYLCVGDNENYYGSHETPEHNRVVFFIGEEKIDENNKKPIVVAMLTSEALMAGIGDKTFDNTVIFFIVCYGGRDTKLLHCYLDHGASAFLGSYGTLNSGVAAYEISRITRMMGTVDEKENCLSLADLAGGAYDAEYEEDFRADVQDMFFQVEARTASGQELKQKQERAYQDFLTYLESDPIRYHLSGADKIMIGKGVLTGFVSDRDRTPFAGTRVTLLRWLDHTYTVQQELTTDEAGVFTAEDLPYGIYAIEAEKDGLEKYVSWIHQPGNTEGIYVVFPFTSVTGTVTVKETGEPAPGAAVTVTDGFTTYQTTAGDDGTYRISGVADGRYSVTASWDALVCNPQQLWTGYGFKGPMIVDIQLTDKNDRMLLIEYLNRVLIPELGLSGFGQFNIGDPHRYDTFGAFYLEMRGISGAHIRDFDGDGAEEMIVAYLRTVSDPDPSNMYPLLGLELRYYDVDEKEQVRALAQQEHLLTNAYDYGTYGVCITQVGDKPYVTVSSYMYDDYSNAAAAVAVYSMTEDSFRKEEGYLLNSYASGATLKQYGGDESEILWQLYNGIMETGEYADIVQLRGSINGSLEKYGLTGMFDRLCAGETLMHGSENRLFFSLMEIVADGANAAGYVYPLQIEDYLLEP